VAHYNPVKINKDCNVSLPSLFAFSVPCGGIWTAFWFLRHTKLSLHPPEYLLMLSTSARKVADLDNSKNIY
jgi:hypothetical protein